MNLHDLRLHVRLVGIVPSLVPYHHARWMAASSISVELPIVVELTNKDEFPVLEFSGACGSYRRLTLFSGRLEAEISASAIRRSVWKMLSATVPDVVCVNGYASVLAFATLEWCSLRGVPVVMCSDSNHHDKTRQKVVECIKRRMVNLSSAALVAGTPQAAYLAGLGLCRNHIFQGYDAVDNLYFAKRNDFKSYTAAEPCPNRNYFFACSRFGEKKNIPRLLEAFARYKGYACSAAWELIIAGDGKLREEIKETIGRLGLSRDVTLLGAVPYEKLPALYSRAGAFVHASTVEQWGLVVNEAMASGLPVGVSNRCGCAPDLVQEGINGFTFDPYSVEEMAEAMLKLSSMPQAQLEAMGRASQRIIAAWGPERFAIGLRAAVAKALEVGPKKATILDRLLLRGLPHLGRLA